MSLHLWLIDRISYVYSISMPVDKSVLWASETSWLQLEVIIIENSLNQNKSIIGWYHFGNNFTFPLPQIVTVEPETKITVCASASQEKE